MIRSGEDETGRPFTVFLLAGEESGDQLGAGLMRALTDRLRGDVRFMGVGGHRMAAAGLQSLYPMHEIGLHGIAAVVTQIPNLLRRRRETAEAVLAARPDVLVTIDIPDFSLGVAKAVRAGDPSIATVHYVMPSVWAYRPGRARKMAAFIDRVLAVLPFEPAVSVELGGPPCTYVGHSLGERVGELRPAPGERQSIEAANPPVLLVLPGSRRSEIKRLSPAFGETVKRVVEKTGPLEIILPAVSHLADRVREAVASWPIKPRIVEGEAEKFAAFHRAHAALAASGTVTLELALSGVPMVVAYRLDPLAQWIRFVFRAKSIVLANLVLGEHPVREYVDWQSTPARLAAGLIPLLGDTPARRSQVEAFAKLDAVMEIGGKTPSVRAAEAILETVSRSRSLQADQPEA
jgi:lipid-A-disaccharide synthase